MNKPAASIQVIDRSARLMEAIAASREPASLKILSAETQLHPSTAFRILSSLVEVGFVERDSAGHYVVGRKIQYLANSVRQGVDIRDLSRDVMQQLRDETDETINLTIRQGDEVIYIERATPNRMMRVEQVIGSRAPLHVTAVGKLMLAELGNAFIRAYSDRSGLKPYTKHTLSSQEALMQSVHEASARGFAYDDEEAEIGVGCIGALIHDKSGCAIAGLSVSAPIERRKDEWAVLLTEAAKKISERL